MLKFKNVKKLLWEKENFHLKKGARDARDNTSVKYHVCNCNHQTLSDRETFKNLKEVVEFYNL